MGFREPDRRCRLASSAIGAIDMRPVLFLAAVLSLAAAPAFSEPAAPPPSNYIPPYPPTSWQDSPFYGLTISSQTTLQCFNGRTVVGASRSGETTVYVQARAGGIFRLEFAEACGALHRAQKLRVRASGGDVVCADDRATVVLQTPAGPQRCKVDRVRHMNRTDVAALAAAARR